MYMDWLLISLVMIVVILFFYNLANGRIAERPLITGGALLLADRFYTITHSKRRPFGVGRL